MPEIYPGDTSNRKPLQGRAPFLTRVLRDADRPCRRESGRPCPDGTWNGQIFPRAQDQSLHSEEILSEPVALDLSLMQMRETNDRRIGFHALAAQP
jgi:hypothetical protein